MSCIWVLMGDRYQQSFLNESRAILIRNTDIFLNHVKLIYISVCND